MKQLLLLIACAAALAMLAGCKNDDDGMARDTSGASSDQSVLAAQDMDDDDEGEDDEGEIEQEVPLDSVPQAVLDAAKAAAPGLVVEKAFTETENGRLLYEIVGTVDGVRHEVEVDAEGNVVEVERGPDDDE